MISPHVEATFGGSASAHHGYHEIGDGTGVGIHHAQAPMGEGDVGNEHRGRRQAWGVGDASEEVMRHRIGFPRQGAVPRIPAIWVDFIHEV